jgi:hypothetical protein
VYVDFVGLALVGEVDRAVVGRFPRARSFIARTAFLVHTSSEPVDSVPTKLPWDSTEVVDSHHFRGGSICCREWIAIATRGRSSSTTTTDSPCQTY